MKPRLLKRILPRGLQGRAALILILPVIVIQLVVAVVIIQRYFEGVTRQMTGNIAIEVAYLTREVNAAPSAAAAQRVAAGLGRALRMRTDLLAPGPKGDARVFYDLSGRQVITSLHNSLPDVRGVDLYSNARQVRMLVGTRWGPMRVVFSRDRVSASNPHQLLVLVVFTSALMTLIAYLFLRNQLRPITRLASAAEEFGKGRTVPYRPRGAVEVRAAGRAFLDMRARIERQIEQRTLMLSGVSHDLRTPLTRMKLSLSMMEDDDEAQALLRDVEHMERLLDAFLSFARGDAMEEVSEVDAAELVAQVVENARRGGQKVTLRPVEISDGEAPRAKLRPQAVTRAVENLLGNAARYAHRAEVRVLLAPNLLRIVVEDDGPGIPEARREEALRPFTRLDAARDPNRGGGVGLGLSIAADTAHSHGGRLLLGDSAMGGLRAELVLAR
ncbi:histidine kinase [Defluviimonas sp. 20V17]|uniref:histidine kinase n=1 Tax=Allgaiera indica TaxID=765699 RepID=A0AAN5A0B2_9RHOB|nr:ATP-binding protein [Allgaiera indica]KDB05429.1 histidine kinase [Defluviimonas sp. 20V17]GHE04094.1 two-component sensor histidine kinase [Allgaiera indica]SDX49215.1 two-component system, OmpR family, osmolarity sensor histidine kinase EnvZ [Allgaiera indica]